MENERWLPVVGYEGVYEVSSLGRVKRVKAATGAKVGRILRHRYGSGGYAQVALSCKCKALKLPVHWLVCAAFIGPRPEGKHINHKNGVPDDNRVENLEYVTLQENILHSRRVLGKCVGEKHGRSKLKDADIPIIRHRLATGEPYKSIAADFGVSAVAIGDIKRGRRWADRRGQYLLDGSNHASIRNSTKVVA